jgi:transglutaminase-like putative cysteine protease
VVFKTLAALAAIPVMALAMAAHADEKPRYAPPAKWVQVAEIPAAPDDPQAPAIQALLDDNQSLHEADGSAYYNRRVARVVKTEGLANAGSRTLTWDPLRERVTIHALAIVRDGKRIDVLQGGKDVLVLRREKNMERAMLDGRMSASIQIKDLQVGDLIDWSYTQERRDPVVGGRTNDFERMGWAGKIGRYRARLLWDEGVPLVWKASTGFPEPKVSKSGKTNELLVDVSGVSTPKSPVGAPARFQRLGELQATTYRGWEDVSTRMAPLYAKGATLAPDSPIRAEAAAIAAASTDPKVRAFAALRLVEDKTRYLFLGMGDGGYKPAPADETWSRRFGDCKGKTVLLLALLRELGIEAEPVLVMAGPGADGLDQRMPAAAQFNHVLVRARIAGKAYWLDGTRSGDRGALDDLEPPPFRWGLPVREAGATLEPIVQEPLARPNREMTLRLDASAGLDKPAAATLTLLMRDDAARNLARSIESTPKADLERGLKQSLSSSMSWINFDRIDWKVAADGEVTVTLGGQADLDWRMNDDLGVREFRLPGSGDGKATTFPRREPGPNSDAPFVVNFPAFTHTVTEVVLPAKGAGYVVKGPNLKSVIAGAEVHHSSGIVDGVARFDHSTRSMAREIPFSDAEEANKTLRRLAGEAQIVRAPKGA